MRGNNAAVSKYQSEKPDYLTILSGSVLDTNKTEVEWCIKEIAHVGGNLKFIIRVKQLFIDFSRFIEQPVAFHF